MMHAPRGGHNILFLNVFLHRMLCGAFWHGQCNNHLSKTEKSALEGTS
jgi:hypothetical protein